VSSVKYILLPLFPLYRVSLPHCYCIISDFIGWMFGVDEKLRGEDQTIDITDDRTGETHIDAQEHIPMYVNEVGYNKKLVQNVLPREITNREVHYFLHLKDPLEEGQEGRFSSHVECLFYSTSTHLASMLGSTPHILRKSTHSIFLSSSSFLRSISFLF